MSKKTLLAIGLAAITSCAAGASFHKGFSIGANVGITDMDGKLNRSFTAIPAADNSNLGARGPVAGLFLGYGWSPHIGGIHIGGAPTPVDISWLLSGRIADLSDGVCL